MTLQEVYGLPVTETHTAPTAVTEYLIPYGAHYNVVPELESVKYSFDLARVKDDPENRFEVKVHAEYWMDHRRFWRVWTVWFDGQPVMVCQNAGREGDDYRRRYITDPERYGALLEFVRSLLPIEAELKDDVKEPGLEIGDPFTFYGETLYKGRRDYD